MVAGALSIVSYGEALTAFSLGPTAPLAALRETRMVRALLIGVFTLGPTAPLAALRETGMVTALLIGVFALGERVTAQRAGAVAAILGGAALILAG